MHLQILPPPDPHNTVVAYYNHQCYKSLNNLTPTAVYSGQVKAILIHRERLNNALVLYTSGVQQFVKTHTMLLSDFLTYFIAKPTSRSYV